MRASPCIALDAWVAWGSPSEVLSLETTRLQSIATRPRDAFSLDGANARGRFKRTLAAIHARGVGVRPRLKSSGSPTRLTDNNEQFDTTQPRVRQMTALRSTPSKRVAIRFGELRPNAVSRKFLVFQSSPCASMQGVVRREYRAYWQGPQRGSSAHGELPKGAPHGACGRVAPLGNGSTIPGGDAPCHRPRGTR